MKKVLVIITTGFVYYGGLTIVMMNLYRHINKETFHIDFASTNEDIDEVLDQELQSSNSRYYSLGDRKKHLWNYVARLSKLLSMNQYDIVHINSNSATASIELYLAKRYGVKKRIVHNHTSSCDHKFLHKFCKPFFSKLYTDAIACSQKAGEWIFTDGKFCILNNGINTEQYRFSPKSRSEIRNLYNIKDNSIVLGHVGKIYKPKNHSFLVDLFASYHRQNPDSLLMLVGDGVMRTEIEDKVKNYGISDSVIFAGMQRNPEKFLSAMDIFCFPSLWEGMPLSMIEAQASGLPCLYSDSIDDGVALTDKAIGININKGIDYWIKKLKSIEIQDRNSSSEKYIQVLREAGYDADINAHELEYIYAK